MTPDSNDPRFGKGPASDTKRDAPRRLMVFIIPLAIVAVIVLLIGVHYTGAIK